MVLCKDNFRGRNTFIRKSMYADIPDNTADDGNAGSATILETTRTIGGVSFNGSADADLPGVNTSGNQDDGNAGSATILETTRTIGGVSFNGSADIDLPGVNTSGNQDTSGTATNATNVTVTENNSTDETVYLTFADASSGNRGIEVDTGSTYNPSSGLITTGALTTTNNVIVGGNLTVSGTTTTVKPQTQ